MTIIAQPSVHPVSANDDLLAIEFHQALAMLRHARTIVAWKDNRANREVLDAARARVDAVLDMYLDLDREPAR